MTSKVAIITGAGSGLGRAISHELGSLGYNCALVGRREEALQETISLGEFQMNPIAIVADVTLTNDRKKIVSDTNEAFRRIDVLVSNAGVSDQQPLLTYTEESWRNVMATNVDALFFLAQQVLPTMKRQKFGRIINIGSVYGSLALNTNFYPGVFKSEQTDGPIRQPAYHTSKGAVLNLTRDLAAAVAPWGITVNCVSPGMFLTEQSVGIISDEVVRSLSDLTPVGRFGDPAEIGYAVSFLASERSGFITGSELVVDGGWSIW
jgi:NAD(P)-dependent dehydrogenase (short-subunit alcohol dehydrogenase family)